MKQKWILFVMSLMLMLFAGSKRTLAQSSYEVGISEIRKANQTKAKLEATEAALQLTLIDLKVYKDSTAFWKAIALRETRRKKGWRKLAIISVMVNIAENSILFLRRK